MLGIYIKKRGKEVAMRRRTFGSISLKDIMCPGIFWKERRRKK